MHDKLEGYAPAFSKPKPSQFGPLQVWLGPRAQAFIESSRGRRIQKANHRKPDAETYAQAMFDKFLLGGKLDPDVLVLDGDDEEPDRCLHPSRPKPLAELHYELHYVDEAEAKKNDAPPEFVRPKMERVTFQHEEVQRFDFSKRTLDPDFSLKFDTDEYEPVDTMPVVSDRVVYVNDDYAGPPQEVASVNLHKRDGIRFTDGCWSTAECFKGEGAPRRILKREPCKIEGWQTGEGSAVASADPYEPYSTQVKPGDVIMREGHEFVGIVAEIREHIGRPCMFFSDHEHDEVSALQPGHYGGYRILKRKPGSVIVGSVEEAIKWLGDRSGLAEPVGSKLRVSADNPAARVGAGAMYMYLNELESLSDEVTLKLGEKTAGGVHLHYSASDVHPKVEAWKNENGDQRLLIGPKAFYRAKRCGGLRIPAENSPSYIRTNILTEGQGWGRGSDKVAAQWKDELRELKMI